MRSLKNLNVKKSIEQNKLVYSESWLDKFGSYIFYLFCLSGFITPFLIFYDPYRDHSKTGFEYYLVFILSIFFVYSFYRKATEKRLIKIVSKYDAKENNLLINEYCEKKGFEKYKNSNNVIIYNTEMALNFNPNYKISRIFLLKGNSIYFTIIRENKLNTPVLFSQISLKRDIENLC
ncbi:hypothetical protein [Flavobacterium sp. KBS0721]|jgi:hypothetical protein|uniref:hypothetical protein n=1 Tax=Flavobacterium sp. KBS0721 TaxID=1179672 RepID=UPI00098FA8C5|nr:hypothetical protein [Flavobacterium sp. KBS0721]QDW19579.1 hypothetical protein B0M43_0005450 [Flavobacterium sp. KBS0721]